MLTGILTINQSDKQNDDTVYFSYQQMRISRHLAHQVSKPQQRYYGRNRCFQNSFTLATFHLYATPTP